MKNIILFTMVILTSIALGDSFTESERLLESEVDQRLINSEPNSTPVFQKQEETKCYPISTVKRWAKRKKKLAPAPVEKIVEKVVEKQVFVEKEVVREAPKNNLSLLAGRTETGLKTDSTYPQFSTHTTGEFDLGLMYERRLSNHIRASAIGTTNGSFYGGLGYDF